MDAGIRCPTCGSTHTDVTDSRRLIGAIRRRRLCNCGDRFTTHEAIGNGPSDVLNLSGASPRLREALRAILTDKGDE